MNREARLDRLSEAFDLVVVGGGITGAGVFALACSIGLRVALIEQRDFAWGTSSRSGKLVHGGLRYMAQGQFATSYHSVREREAMLRSYAGLVHPLSFAIPVPGGNPIMKLGLGGVLALYDAMAGRRSRRYWRGDALAARLPGLKGVDGGVWTFTDGTTDDARLVMRVVDEGQQLGGIAVNYTEASGLMIEAAGNVVGVKARDVIGGREIEVRARAVVNATGAWADTLRGAVGEKPRMRPLRGSHLVVARERLPVELAIALKSPKDRRNMYLLPWEGRVLIGTTDLDHHDSLQSEPSMTSDEGSYLLDAIHASFPDANIGESDVISTFSGVRPVVASGHADPSKESREESVWVDRGLVTITGGKLTTFRRMAQRALRAARPFLPMSTSVIAVERPPVESGSSDARLVGRFGAAASEVRAGDGPLRATIASTDYTLAELCYSARHEQVVHLDDLLLRRTRIGLLCEDGGMPLLDVIEPHVRASLQWSAETWNEEVARYRAMWNTSYSPQLIRR